ncbi:MAG: MFS transporter [Cyanobacteriota bacterium]|nr:MFS transporter [Cyanobacteriota bacterium]
MTPPSLPPPNVFADPEPETLEPALASPGARSRLMIAYGFGDAGTGMAAGLIGFYLFVFYTSAAGLAPWMAGLVLMLARLWDAINDPIVGWLSDRTRHPTGPRLPWMVWSAIPLGAAMALMWWLPPGSPWLKFAFFVAISVVANSLYTCVNLPYTALMAEVTTSTTLRTRLNRARFTGSILAGLVGLTLGGLLLRDHSNPASYWRLGLLSGLIITATTLTCCWGIAPAARHAQRPTPSSGSTRRLLGRIGANGRFLRVLGLYLLLWCALQLMQTAALIFLPVVMRLPESWSNWILLPFQISTLVGLQLWTLVSHRQGRLRALAWGAGLWVAGCLGAMLLVPLDTGLPPLGSLANQLRLLALVAAILVVGLGAATAYLIPWSLLPDAIDVDPEKPAGLFSAFMVFVQKLCISLVLFSFGSLMTFSGYVPTLGTEQPDGALVAIRLCMGLIPAVLVVLGVLVMRRWPKGPQRMLALETP